MDLRYGMRRLLMALIAAAVVGSPLVVLFCPVAVMKASLFPHTSVQGVEFRPLWRLQGDILHESWFCLEDALALFIGAGVWFVYPQFRPPAPPS